MTCRASSIGALAMVLIGAFWACGSSSGAAATACGAPGPGAVQLTNQDDTYYVEGGAGATIYGLGGDDKIIGGPGDDQICAGPGSDVVYGGGGSDRLDGEDGTDVLSFDDPATDGVFVSLAANEALDGLGGTDQLSSFETVVGSAHDDTLVGDDLANTLLGNGGRDRISGHGGADVLDGGDGADLLVGGAGEDVASYADSSEPVRADLALGRAATGASSDRLVGVEDLEGSPFNDKLAGDGGSNTLAGLNGSDQLLGGAGLDLADYQHLVDATPRLPFEIGFVPYELRDAGAASVNLQHGTGRSAGDPDSEDTIAHVEGAVGSTESDSLVGAPGRNILVGLDGSDTLVGRSGADLLSGGRGSDQLHGGHGIGDSTHYLFLQPSEGGIAADLQTKRVEVSTEQDEDALSSIEVFIGSPNDDVIFGGDGPDVIRGDAGADQIYGRDGDDTLYADAGQDTIDGGGDTDRCVPPEGTQLMDASNCESDQPPPAVLAELLQAQAFLAVDPSCPPGRRPCPSHPKGGRHH